ncbi:MAG TPA: hypothetical protein VIL53_02610 [Solirubrobacterales bacterium]
MAVSWLVLLDNRWAEVRALFKASRGLEKARALDYDERERLQNEVDDALREAVAKYQAQSFWRRVRERIDPFMPIFVIATMILAGVAFVALLRWAGSYRP